VFQPLSQPLLEHYYGRHVASKAPPSLLAELSQFREHVNESIVVLSQVRPRAGHARTAWGDMRMHHGALAPRPRLRRSLSRRLRLAVLFWQRTSTRACTSLHSTVAVLVRSAFVCCCRARSPLPRAPTRSHACRSWRQT
jgi:PDZ domain